MTQLGRRVWSCRAQSWRLRRVGEGGGGRGACSTDMGLKPWGWREHAGPTGAGGSGARPGALCQVWRRTGQETAERKSGAEKTGAAGRTRAGAQVTAVSLEGDGPALQLSVGHGCGVCGSLGRSETPSLLSRGSRAGGSRPVGGRKCSAPAQSQSQPSTGRRWPGAGPAGRSVGPAGGWKGYPA